MEIDINSIRGKSPDGGTNGPRQKTQTVLLVEGIVRSCRAVSNYEMACTMLLEILPIVSSDPAAMDVFLRGKEEIRQFFENRNTPQPSTKYEGCNVILGAQDGQFIGKESKMEVDINSPGNQIVNEQHNNKKIDE